MSKLTSRTWTGVVREWDYFDSCMRENGYRLIIHSGDPGLTDGTIAIKDDKYVPIIRFLVFRTHKDEYTFAIKVEDRNGDSVINGKTIGYIRFEEYTRENLKKAINFILETFGCYNANNTVPTKFETIEITF